MPDQRFNSVFAGLGTTVFEVMSRLARTHDAINLGQGFPDGAGPDDVRRAAAEALLDGWNQYPPMLGIPELRQAVADHDDRFHGLAVDWETEVMVTSGATEAIAASLLALLEPGDEVIVFQPAYDSYVPMIRRAGGVPRFVDLVPPDWRFDPDQLRNAVSSRTRAVLINTPHNPTASVFDMEALSVVAEVVDATGAVAICDEVYEHIIFDDRLHVPLMTLPGMRDRCLRIGSAGKTFSLTGWKVGYVVGAPALIAAVAKAHQFLVFTTPPNLQRAVAFGLSKDSDYFDGLVAEMEAKRDLFVDGLTDCGLTVLPCSGTYFAVIDIGSADDAEYCRRLITETGVAAIPLSAFFGERPWRHGVRFCFAKADAVLEAAIDRLSRAV